MFTPGKTLKHDNICKLIGPTFPYNHFIRMQSREGAAAYRGCHWVKTGLHLTTIHSYSYGQRIVSNPPSCFWTVGGPASDSDLGFKPSILLL